MNVNKQTVVIVGRLKVISIKTPEKNPSKWEIFGSENINKRKWAGLSKRSMALLREKSDRSEKKNAEHFDRIGVRGEKERQIFALVDQSDTIWGKERSHC